MRLSSLFLCLVLFVIVSCSQVNLASHVAKKIPDVASEGNFKVGSPYKVMGQWYQPQEDYSYVETGIASWYGPGFHGKKTANGETFNMNELTAAHKTLQLPSLVRVTNLENGRSVVVRVNDRGPFKRGRIIDMSKRGAELLDFKNSGVAKVRVQVLAEESKKIANAARRGENTRGYEVAINKQTSKRRPAPASTQPAVERGQPREIYQEASLQSKPVERAMLPPPDVPGHTTREGIFYPDQIVEQAPVSNTNMYVQAGAFADRANAQKLAQKLAPFGKAKVYPANVNGQQFFRVRIPASDVQSADAILSRLANAGNGDAIIIVE
ncbi:MAG: hypothetical protein DHS20C02_05470 [Micavibrio sp.]|nr:MAG: hypothetical protein DHS20C02_05470 [Micavibrio sp.]